MDKNTRAKSTSRRTTGGMARQTGMVFIQAGLILLFQGCATAPQQSPSDLAHSQAKAAYLANDYQRTIAIAEPRAVAGESWAQYTLGYLYYYGQGAPLDREAGKQWMQRAAEQGYAPAQEAMKRLMKPAPRTEEEITTETPAPQTVDAKNTSAPVPSLPQAPQTQMQVSTEAAPKESVTAPAPATTAAPMTETAPPSTTQQTAPVTEPPAAVMNPGFDGGMKALAWVRMQNPQHYTLQLISAGNETAIRNFIEKNDLQQKAVYYATTRQGQPWFTVIYGSYADHALAQQALAGLSPALRRAAPWTRRFADIQSLLESSP